MNSTKLLWKSPKIWPKIYQPLTHDGKNGWQRINMRSAVRHRCKLSNSWKRKIVHLDISLIFCMRQICGKRLVCDVKTSNKSDALILVVLSVGCDLGEESGEIDVSDLIRFEWENYRSDRVEGHPQYLFGAHRRSHRDHIEEAERIIYGRIDRTGFVLCESDENSWIVQSVRQRGRRFPEPWTVHIESVASIARHKHNYTGKCSAHSQRRFPAFVSFPHSRRCFTKWRNFANWKRHFMRRQFRRQTNTNVYPGRLHRVRVAFAIHCCTW